jgi:hypothetical protein
MKNINEHDALPAGRKLGKVNWGTAAFLLIAHLAALAAPFFWSWRALITRSFSTGSGAAWASAWAFIASSPIVVIACRRSSSISW